MLDEAKPDRFSFGRPVLLAAASEDSVYDIDDLSCKYDAVIVACGAEAARRCALNLDKDGVVAAAAKAVGFREVCVRAYASDNASNESDADGVTVSSSSIAVARCGVVVDGEVVARRAGGGAKLYEAVLTPTAPPAAKAALEKRLRGVPAARVLEAKAPKNAERLARKAGVADEALPLIKANAHPRHLDGILTAEELAAYPISRELALTTRVSDETYASTKAVLGGDRAMADLSLTIACYHGVSVLLNSFEVALPEGVEKPFPEE